jgi:hypothetical protein
MMVIKVIVNIIMTEIEDLKKRISALECNFGKKPKADKKPRKPSEYNNFVKKYFKDNKGTDKTHKELFIDASKAWGVKKAEK